MTTKAGRNRQPSKNLTFHEVREGDVAPYAPAPRHLREGWRSVRLEELVVNPRSDIVDGPFGSNLKASEYQPAGVPILRLQNVGAGFFIDKNIRFLTREKAESLRRHSFVGGDILVTKLGDPLGEACIVPKDFGSGVIVADLVRVRVNALKADERAVCHAINSPQVQQQFKALTKGTTRPRVNLAHVRDVRLMLPASLDRQRQMVAELEAHLTRLEASVTALKRVQANLKRYRASVLKAAFKGRLVPTETGTDAWSRKSLGDVARVVGGLTKNPKRAKLVKELPYLRVANVYANQLRLEEIEYIGVAEAELEKLLLKTGDLLIVEGNGSKDQIGRVALWDGSIDPCVHQNHLIKVRLTDSAIPKWILFWLLSPQGRKHIERVSSSTSGLYTLSVGKVAALPVVLPPLAEQEHIVAEVERHLSVVEELEVTVAANLKRAERLRQSVLASAFAAQ